MLLTLKAIRRQRIYYQVFKQLNLFWFTANVE